MLGDSALSLSEEEPVSSSGWEHVGPEALQSPDSMGRLWKTAGGVSSKRPRTFLCPTCSCPQFSILGQQVGVDPVDKRPNRPPREQSPPVSLAAEGLGHGDAKLLP